MIQTSMTGTHTATKSLTNCDWCGEPSVALLTIQPDRYTYKNGKDGKKIKILRKRAITAEVCAHHLKTLELKKNRGSEEIEE